MANPFDFKDIAATIQRFTKDSDAFNTGAPTGQRAPAPDSTGIGAPTTINVGPAGVGPEFGDAASLLKLSQGLTKTTDSKDPATAALTGMAERAAEARAESSIADQAMSNIFGTPVTAAPAAPPDKFFDLPLDQKLSDVTASSAWASLPYADKDEYLTLYQKSQRDAFARVLGDAGLKDKDLKEQLKRFDSTFTAKRPELLGAKPTFSITDSDWVDGITNMAQKLSAYGDYKAGGSAVAYSEAAKAADDAFQAKKSALTLDEEKASARRNYLQQVANAKTDPTNADITPAQEVINAWEDFKTAPIRTALSSTGMSMIAGPLAATAGRITGGVIGGALGSVVPVAGTAAGAAVGQHVLGTAAASAVEVPFTAQDAVDGALANIRDTPDAELIKSPMMQAEMKANGGDFARAKGALMEHVAREADTRGQLVGGASAMADMYLGSGKLAGKAAEAMGSTALGMSKKGIINSIRQSIGLAPVDDAISRVAADLGTKGTKGVARTVGALGVDAAKEAVVEGTTQYQSNQAVASAGLNINPWEGVASSATLGAIIGPAVGGTTQLGTKALDVVGQKYTGFGSQGVRLKDGEYVVGVDGATGDLTRVRRARDADLANFAADPSTGLMRQIDTESSTPGRTRGADELISEGMLAYNNNRRVLGAAAMDSLQGDPNAPLVANLFGHMVAAAQYGSAADVARSNPTALKGTGENVQFIFNGNGIINYRGVDGAPVSESAQQEANALIAQAQSLYSTPLRESVSTFFGRTAAPAVAPTNPGGSIVDAGVADGYLHSAPTPSASPAPFAGMNPGQGGLTTQVASSMLTRANISGVNTTDLAAFLDEHNWLNDPKSAEGFNTALSAPASAVQGRGATAVRDLVRAYNANPNAVLAALPAELKPAVQAIAETAPIEDAAFAANVARAPAGGPSANAASASNASAEGALTAPSLRAPRGKTTPPAQARIAVMDALTELSSGRSPYASPSQRRLAQALKQIFQTSNIPVPETALAQLASGIAGDYTPNKHAVRIRTDAAASTFIHELLHAATFRGLERMNELAREGNRKAARTAALIEHIHTAAKQAAQGAGVGNPGNPGAFYALHTYKNMSVAEQYAEMFAELGNPAFIQLLQGVPFESTNPTPELRSIFAELHANTNGTLFDALVSAIRALLRYVSVRNAHAISEATLAEALLTATHEAVSLTDQAYGGTSPTVATNPRTAPAEEATEPTAAEPEPAPVPQPAPAAPLMLPPPDANELIVTPSGAVIPRAQFNDMLARLSPEDRQDMIDQMAGRQPRKRRRRTGERIADVTDHNALRWWENYDQQSGRIVAPENTRDYVAEVQAKVQANSTYTNAETVALIYDIMEDAWLAQHASNPSADPVASAAAVADGLVAQAASAFDATAATDARVRETRILQSLENMIAGGLNGSTNALTQLNLLLKRNGDNPLNANERRRVVAMLNAHAAFTGASTPAALPGTAAAASTPAAQEAARVDNSSMETLIPEARRSEAPTPTGGSVGAIRAALAANYGDLASTLESKGLLSLVETEAEAVELLVRDLVQAQGVTEAEARETVNRQLRIGSTELDVRAARGGAIEGFFHPATGKSYMVASALTPETAGATLMHEVGVHAANDGTLNPLFARASELLMQPSEDPILREAARRWNAAGETSGEEAMAYIVTVYETTRNVASPTVAQFIQDLIAAIRAWANRTLGISIDPTPADLAAIARANARSLSRGGVANGEGGARTSRAADAARAQAAQDYRDTEERIGGRDAYDRAKADGKTKLNYGQWVTVRTPNFKAWFGDWENDPTNASKVIDPDTGEPLVVYHGTSKDQDFTRFKVGARGAWFTSDVEEASAYAALNDSMGPRYNPESRRYEDRNTAARVMPVFVRVARPYRLTAEEAIRVNTSNYAKAQRELFPAIKAKGYDGILWNDTMLKEWVVLGGPEQIKSATGNTGAFSGTSADVRFSRTTAATDAAGTWADARGIARGAAVEGGSAAPSLSFDQPTGYTFTESEYRPSVVAFAKTRFGDSVAPNGKPAWQNFTRWFGDSQVVDADGKPLVVYHGAATGFSTFDERKIGDRDPGFFGAGFYFTPNEGEAQDYADSAVDADGADGGEVIPAFLAIQNPFVWDMEAGDGAKATRHALAAMGIARSSVRGDSAALSNSDDRRKFAAVMKAAGHDGVIVRDEDGIREVVAFRPNQIKSATGNNGDFDPARPGILFSRTTAATDAALAGAPATPVRGPSFLNAARTRNPLEAKSKWNALRQRFKAAFVTHLAPVEEAIDAIPDRLNARREQLMADLWLAPNRRDWAKQEAEHRFGGADMTRILGGMANRTKASAETVLRDVGFYHTARYVQIKMAEMTKADRAAAASAARALADAQARNAPRATILKLTNELRAAEKLRDDRAYAYAHGKIGQQEHFGPDGAAAQRALENAEAALAANPNDVAAQKAVDKARAALNSHRVGIPAGMPKAEAEEFIRKMGAKYGVAELEKASKAMNRLMGFRLALDLMSGRTTVGAASAFAPELQALTAQMQAIVNASRAVSTTNPSTRAVLDRALDDFVTRYAAASKYVPTTGAVNEEEEALDVFGQGVRAPNVATDRRLEGRSKGRADSGINAGMAALYRSASDYGWLPFKQGIAALYNEATPAERAALGMNTPVDITVLQRLGDNIIIHDGKGYTFGGDDVMQAIRGENIDGTSDVVKALTAGTFFLAKAMTQWDPTFGPRNAVRDLWERTENVRARKLTDANGKAVDPNKVANRALRIGANPKFYKEIAAFISGDGRTASSDTARWLKEAMAAGFGGARRLEMLGTDRRTLVEAIEGSNSNVRKGMTALGHVVHQWNTAFDSVAPLAIYIAMREAGMTDKQAAYKTLDLMNFRKQGSAMGFVRVLYAFAQPAVTGGHQLIRSASTREGMVRIAAYTVGFAVIKALLAGIAGDDDDLDRKKTDLLDEFTKDRVLAIPMPGGGIAKMPIGYGIPMLGNAIAQVGRESQLGLGDKSWTDTAEQFITRALLPQISPIEDSKISTSDSPSGAMVQTFAPTMFAPIIDVAINRSGFGKEIIREEFEDPNRPKSAQGSPFTAGFYQDAAKLIYSMSGGTLDYAPEQVRAIIQGYTPGALGMARKATIDNPNATASGRGVTTPLVDRFYIGDNPNKVIGEIAAFQERGERLLKTISRDLPEDVARGDVVDAVREQLGSIESPSDRATLSLYLDYQDMLEDFKGEARALTASGTPKDPTDPDRAALSLSRNQAQIEVLNRWYQIKGE